jgi:hypothetical protein
LNKIRKDNVSILTIEILVFNLLIILLYIFIYSIKYFIYKDNYISKYKYFVKKRDNYVFTRSIGFYGRQGYEIHKPLK